MVILIQGIAALIFIHYVYNLELKETSTLTQAKYMQICRVLHRMTTLIEEFGDANTKSIMSTDYNSKTVIFPLDICYLASVR